MAAAGFAKLGIYSIILVQFLIGNAGSKCVNVEFNNFWPCEYETVLISNQGPCNVLLRDSVYATNQPTVRLETAEEAKKYLLIMLDPDAPDPDDPEYKFWIHWIVYSIEGSALRDGIVKGQEIFTYTAPTPPYGVHRYQFFVFEQPSTFDGGSITITDRGKFDLDEFASRHDLCNNLKGSYQYYATEEYILTRDVLMVSRGNFTMPLEASTTLADSGGRVPDAPAAPKDSAAVTKDSETVTKDSETVMPDHKATKRRTSGFQSVFPSRVDKIRFILLLFCATYACKPSC